MPYANTTILPQGLPDESDDASKLFTNIDTEDFICKWDGIPHIVKAGETVTKPKYLVNFLAMHLARKMYKRSVFAGKTEAEKAVGVFPIRNEVEEKKLQEQMVKENFPQNNETLTSSEVKEEVKKKRK